MTARILVVDDEPDLVEPVAFNLRREGFETRVAVDARSALEELARDPTPDLILLDVMLPDQSGTEVCRRIKGEERTKRIPVVFLSAMGDEIDRVVGFELGAEDYIVKPFSMRELVLRVRSILRHARANTTPGDGRQAGRVRIDPSSHRTWIDGEEVMLTALEFELLQCLVRRGGRVCTRDQLLDEVWGDRTAVTARAVDSHIKRLRTKLGAASDDVETIRGVGYRMRTDAE